MVLPPPSLYLKVTIVLMKHYDQKTTWRGKALIYTSILLFIIKGCQTGQDLKVGADAEAMAVLPIGLFPVAVSKCFLIEPRTTAREWNQPRWVIQTQIKCFPL